MRHNGIICNHLEEMQYNYNTWSVTIQDMCYNLDIEVRAVNNLVSIHTLYTKNILIIVKDAVNIYRSFMKRFLLQAIVGFM